MKNESNNVITIDHVTCFTSSISIKHIKHAFYDKDWFANEAVWRL